MKKIYVYFTEKWAYIGYRLDHIVLNMKVREVIIMQINKINDTQPSGSKENSIKYAVKIGDNIAGIVDKLYKPESKREAAAIIVKIIELNEIKDVRKLQIDQVLTLPSKQEVNKREFIKVIDQKKIDNLMESLEMYQNLNKRNRDMLKFL